MKPARDVTKALVPLLAGLADQADDLAAGAFLAEMTRQGWNPRLLHPQPGGRPGTGPRGRGHTHGLPFPLTSPPETETDRDRQHPDPAQRGHRPTRPPPRTSPTTARRGHAIAGVIQLTRAGIAPGTFEALDPTPGPATITGRLRAALAALDRVDPLDGPPDLMAWSCRRPTPIRNPSPRPGQAAVSATTASDLLARAHRLAIDLRDSREPLTVQEWERFDVTLHRTVHAELGADASYVHRRDPYRHPLLSAIRAYPHRCGHRPTSRSPPPRPPAC